MHFWLVSSLATFTTGALTTYAFRSPPLNYRAIKVLGEGGLRGITALMLTVIPAYYLQMCIEGKDFEISFRGDPKKYPGWDWTIGKWGTCILVLNLALTTFAAHKQWTTCLGTPAEALMHFVISSAVAVLAYDYGNGSPAA